VIVHGVRDERVPWRVSVEFAEICPHRPLDVVLYGDGDHRLQARAADMARVAEGFFEDAERRARPAAGRAARSSSPER
jgi:hypothetical protein